MRWKKVTINTTTEATEYLAYELSELGIDSVEIEDLIPVDDTIQGGNFAELQPDLPEDNGEACISFYLDEDADDEALLDSVYELVESAREFMNVGSGDITFDISDEEDWRDNWKAFFKAFTIGDILIRPTWENESGEYESVELADGIDEGINHVINIDPGIAFGTGKHESTHICIEEMQKRLKPGDRVLDVGFGSGILSVAALTLGAGSVSGTDIDDFCTTAIADNMAVNNLTYDPKRFAIGDLTSNESVQEVIGTGYDVVFANILADIIIGMADKLYECTREGGILITSGIIDFKCEQVADALKQAGFEIVSLNEMGEWRGITAERN